MKRVIFLFLATLFISTSAIAQRIEIEQDSRGNDYLAVYAYGLQREIVKTNSEMRASVNDAGIMRRHHTTKGDDERVGKEGYIANSKISFGFLVSPYDININGEKANGALLTWTQASGWDPSIDNVDCTLSTGTNVGVGDSPIAASPTGCSKYKGIDGKDNEGDWRLPTQREFQVMFTVIEQAEGYLTSGAVEGDPASGIYWTATEFAVPGAGSPWNAWCIDCSTGITIYAPRNSSTTHSVRCVKDIFNPINER